MNTFSPASISATRFLCCLAVLLLVGCAAPNPQVGVTSPPPPLIGSAPISAYDDYALALATMPKVRVEAVAVNSPR